MKKNLIFTACILSIIAISSVATFKSLIPNIEQTSELLSENAEALTNGEEFEYPTGYPFSSRCGVKISRWQKCSVMVITCQGGGSGCNSKKCPTHPA